jgi:DnaJ domain
VALDLYETLRISPNAEPDIIDSTYRRLALKYHPDVNHSPGAQTHMAAINHAYAVLRDPIGRARYDAERRSSTHPYRCGSENSRAPSPPWEEPKRYHAARPAAWSGIPLRQTGWDFRVVLALVLAVTALALALDMQFVGPLTHLSGGSPQPTALAPLAASVGTLELEDVAAMQEAHAVNAAMVQAFSTALAIVLSGAEKESVSHASPVSKETDAGDPRRNVTPSRAFESLGRNPSG